MIKAENGSVHIKGSAADILVDYSMVTESMLGALTDAGATKERAAEDLKRAFDIGMMSREERRDEIRKKIEGPPSWRHLKNTA